jgi:toxin HigB-1
MIRSFLSRGLREFHESGATRRLPVQNANRVRQILLALEAARRPGDMNIPGFVFHPLGRMAPGRYAVRVTGNYRVTFAWSGDDAVDVDIEDYH